MKTSDNTKLYDPSVVRVVEWGNEHDPEGIEEFLLDFFNDEIEEKDVPIRLQILFDSWSDSIRGECEAV